MLAPYMFNSWRAEFDKKTRELCALHVQLATTLGIRDYRRLDASRWLQRYKLGRILLNDLARSVVHFSMVAADVSLDQS